MARKEADTIEKNPGSFRVTITAYRCRCGYEWLSRRQLNRREERPTVCPACKSPRWDKPFKFRAADRKRRS